MIVVAGGLGYLGVKSRSAITNSDDGSTRLEVHYTQVARAGLDVPFRITIHRRGGFEEEGLTLAVSSRYLELFDRNTIEPEPSSATTTARDTLWQFDRPPGDTLVVSLDIQVQKGRHWGRSGTVRVLDATGAPTARVSLKTWLSP